MYEDYEKNEVFFLLAKDSNCKEMNIKQIKENKTCLDYLGAPLKKTSSGWYIYRCPWKTDAHPSLTVSPDGKVWRDLSTGAEGGIIELVMTCLNTHDFRLVCAAFNSSSFLPLRRVFDNEKEKKSECSGFASFCVMPLQSRGLCAYLAKRKINMSIARQFLQEAHYSFQERTDDSYLYALAYKNDKGGYELRSESFKGSTAPKGITTHLGVANASTIVFEGVFDMLSWVTMTEGVKHNLIVLNSVVNKEDAVKMLRSVTGKIILCLDNDKGGNTATAFILNAVPGAIDYRSHFAPAKDVNEYLKTRELSG